jgi:hypothetical protein
MNGFADVQTTGQILEAPFPASDPSHVVRRAASQSSPIYFAAIFGWTMSAVSAAMCAIVRMPLGSPHWLVFAKAWLLAAAIISCATVLTVWCVERRRSGYALVLVPTLAVIFLPCLAWLIGRATDIVAYPLLLGLVAIGVRQVVAARGMPGSRFTLALACGCVAGAGYFFLVNSRGYATVLTPELALVGTQHLDTLFHASIANMLVKHGALSTGIDGLVPIKYHVLSHIWLGCLGLWLGVTTLDAYYIGAQIVAIPVLLFSLALATHLLRSPETGLTDNALVTLMPLLLLFIVDLWGWTHYLVSESYFLAMILFLLSLPLLAEIAADQFRLRPSLQVAALVIVGILILVSKISVGVIFWGAAGFLLWRQLGLTFLNLIKLAPPILLLVGLFAAISSPDSETYVHAVSLFSFIRVFPHGAWPNILANLVLLYAASRIWLSGSARDRKCAETFAIIAIGSLLPALLLDIAGGSDYYFANVGTWACIVFLIAYGTAIFGERSLRLLTPGAVILAILVVVLATDEKTGSLKKFATQFEDLRTRVRKLNGESTGAEITTRQRLFELLAPGHPARQALAEEVKRTPGAQAMQTLQSMGMSQDRHAAVFVPPDNAAFWSTYEDCRGDPFFVPAILGAPMLKGLNPSALKCARDPYYSFAVYPPAAGSEASTDQQLCARAADLGFDTVVVLMTPATGRKMQCAKVKP